MLSALILSEHSYPALPLTRQLEHQRFVRPGPLVLRSESLNSPAPTVDKDRTVSRRSEPSSRTTLTGEQPDPWDLLQPQDVMSRHRGAKPSRRYELLDSISLLSLAYLLSVERWQFHFQPPDHLDLLSHLLDLYVLQSGWLISIYSNTRLPTGLSQPSYSSVTLWEDTAPVKLTGCQCPRARLWTWVRFSNSTGWCFIVDSTCPERQVSKSPTYAKQ